MKKGPSLELLRKGPLLLAPDNFTPLSRTPWGGFSIGQRYKRELLPGVAGKAIGEAWEFSCDPDFPSQVLGQDITLAELVQTFPEAVLSPKHMARTGGTCEILVKLLNAAQPLSLQVHPPDNDPHLKASECGKPESWLVLAAEPGAGLYLGFKRTISKAELRAALADGRKAEELLHFVEVQPGDYFEIDYGVAHSIGAGVTLLEPQRILFGKSGKTYRLWDWGRRYDVHGLPDQAAGQPRPLHIEESLALVDPESQVGSAFVDSLRRPGSRSRPVQGLEVVSYPDNTSYATTLVSCQAGSGFSLKIEDGYGAMLITAGRLQYGDMPLLTGQPALLPHIAMPLRFESEVASQFAIVVPHGATMHFGE